jgi:hypothetical protein
VTSRTVALTLGVSYAVLTALELFGGWALGGSDIVLRTTKTNLLHWAVALGLLGSHFSGPEPARIAIRVAGVILAGIGVWGFLAAASLGDVLGFSGDIPTSYNAFHLVTGAGALFFGFSRAREPA